MQLVIELSRLKELRKKRKYTQIKVQMLTGIDQSDYSKIENGSRSLTFEQCRKLALALETSMDYLAGITDEPTPKGRAALMCGPVPSTWKRWSSPP